MTFGCAVYCDARRCPQTVRGLNQADCEDLAGSAGWQRIVGGDKVRHFCANHHREEIPHG